MRRYTTSTVRFLIITVLIAITLSLAAVSQAGAAGEDWQSQDSTVTTPRLFGLYFLDDGLTGWAVGGETGPATVLKTTDGGVNWVSQDLSLSSDPFAVYFVNDTTGWITGNAGLLLKTTNGGASWTPQDSTVEDDLRGMSFLDEDTGWIATYGGNVLKTVNGGDTWTEMTTGVDSGIVLVDVDFVSATVGWAVGESGWIIKTTNGGTSWAKQPQAETTSWLFNGSFYDENKGWVSGSLGKVLYTENGGSTWTAQTTNTTDTIRCVHFLDDETGWGVGQNGIVIHTTNGGSTWTTQTSDTTEYLRWVYMHNATLGWAVGQGGVILITGEPPDPDPPVAAFSADIISAEIGDTITFSDQSTGNPTSWSWDFDNDGTADSGLQNPTYTYDTAGTYTVKLTATNTGGSDDEIKENYVFIVAANSQLVPPDVATEIDSSDGGVKINFAAGSVTQRAEIAITEITEVPQLPAGYTLGTSLYDINITNDQGAAITTLEVASIVTFDYKSLDAANAGGADKLKLAYYDETAEQWMILTTTADTTARTLTAETTHLSKWAVISGEAAGGGCCASATATVTDIASGWALLGMLGVFGCYLARRNGKN